MVWEWKANIQDGPICVVLGLFGFRRLARTPCTYHVLAAWHILIIFLGIILLITRHRHLGVKSCQLLWAPMFPFASDFFGFSNRFFRSLQQCKYRDSWRRWLEHFRMPLAAPTEEVGWRCTEGIPDSIIQPVWSLQPVSLLLRKLKDQNIALALGPRNWYPSLHSVCFPRWLWLKTE